MPTPKIIAPPEERPQTARTARTARPATAARSAASEAAADDALDQLHELMHQYRSHMHGLARGGADGLGPMEARTLGFFARHPDATATDLVQHARRDKAQMTRLVKLLLERGLLEAVPDPADRRSRRLRLTDEGRAMQATMQRHRKRLAQQLVAGFDAEELESLLKALTRLRANFQPEPTPANEDGAEPDPP